MVEEVEKSFLPPKPGIFPVEDPEEGRWKKRQLFKPFPLLHIFHILAMDFPPPYSQNFTTEPAPKKAPPGDLAGEFFSYFLIRLMMSSMVEENWGSSAFSWRIFFSAFMTVV